MKSVFFVVCVIAPLPIWLEQSLRLLLIIYVFLHQLRCLLVGALLVSHFLLLFLIGSVAYWLELFHCSRFVLFFHRLPVGNSPCPSLNAGPQV